MKRQDILENQVKYVYLGIGSNLGNKKLNLEKAMHLLKNNNIEIVCSSKVYESLSWPNKKFPNYFNIVIKIRTILNPLKLFYLVKKIEKNLGRNRAPKNHPRICDIDIIDYDRINKSFKVNNDIVVIPHPRAHKRNFVLFPLFELDQNWKHPKFKSKITKLIMNLPLKDLSTIKLI